MKTNKKTLLLMVCLVTASGLQAAEQTKNDKQKMGMMRYLPLGGVQHHSRKECVDPTVKEQSLPALTTNSLQSIQATTIKNYDPRGKTVFFPTKFKFEDGQIITTWVRKQSNNTASLNRIAGGEQELKKTSEKFANAPYQAPVGKGLKKTFSESLELGTTSSWKQFTLADNDEDGNGKPVTILNAMKTMNKQS